jgi:hypothetical protein
MKSFGAASFVPVPIPCRSQAATVNFPAISTVACSRYQASRFTTQPVAASPCASKQYHTSSRAAGQEHYFNTHIHGSNYCRSSSRPTAIPAPRASIALRWRKEEPRQKKIATPRGRRRRRGESRGCVQLWTAHFYALWRPVCQVPKDGEGIWGYSWR